MPDLTPIQRLVLPNLEIQSPENTYIRCPSGGVTKNLTQRSLYLQKGATVTFDTYYNIFTIDKWKSECEIDDLYLKISGTGSARVHIFYTKNDCNQQIIDEYDICLNNGSVENEILGFKKYNTGFISFSITALNDFIIYNESRKFFKTPSLRDGVSRFV